ncbi:hypothetical protein [Ekhidna sp. To15]|uniref:hypothetical protein n=1 Tax=Ekhidna sp. To15 TaxID=3395267 RepID=UPI003F51DFB3
MTKLTKDQIDNYHSGRMNESEMADFASKLESDPAIKAESDFQSDIISGLKEYRKLELKSRLDAINVGPTWIEFAQQSALMKSLGGIVVASVIGTGIYFYGERPEVEGSDIPATVQGSEIESIEFIWDLGKEEPQTDNTLEKPRNLVTEADETKDVEQQAISQIVEAEGKRQVAKEEVFTPSFEAPKAESIEEESEFTTTGLDEIPNSVEGTDEQPIDVQTEISKSTVIKYKYYDGKLFLNGDFNKAPYEILEINSSNGRRIYVYFLGNYYRVGMADKMTELPRVTNSEVISELKLLRENKKS